MTAAVRKPRVVRTADLQRVVAFLEGKGDHPTAYDLLPGGVVRIHLVEPVGAPAEDDGAAGWDAALAV